MLLAHTAESALATSAAIVIKNAIGNYYRCARFLRNIYLKLPLLPTARQRCKSCEHGNWRGLELFIRFLRICWHIPCFIALEANAYDTVYDVDGIELTGQCCCIARLRRLCCSALIALGYPNPNCIRSNRRQRNLQAW
jgi:hypothetical protein